MIDSANISEPLSILLDAGCLSGYLIHLVLVGFLVVHVQPVNSGLSSEGIHEPTRVCFGLAIGVGRRIALGLLIELSMKDFVLLA